MMRAFKKLLRFIFVGALSLFPLMLVLIIVNFFKNLSLDAYIKVGDYTNSDYATIAIIVSIITALAFLGWTIEQYGRSVFISTVDKIIAKIPAISTIYSVSKKISNMLTGKDDSGKKEVVLVEYPKKDVWVPAYLLNRYNGVNVLFVPTSPNPTSGYTVLVKETLTIKTTLTLEEASAFIISMGADFAKKDEITQKIQQNKWQL